MKILNPTRMYLGSDIDLSKLQKIGLNEVDKNNKKLKHMLNSFNIVDFKLLPDH